MESKKRGDPYVDNRDSSRQSLRTTGTASRESSLQRHKKNNQDKTQDEDKNDDVAESRMKIRTWRSDPDRDRMSGGDRRRSSQSFYSDEYDNESPSVGSVSAYSQSRTPSPTLPKGMRTKMISCSPLYKTGGARRRGVSRPQRPGGQPRAQHYRRGMRSESKDSTPPRDLDLVTKRMLSARLIKINELRNSLSELQQRTDELQKENRILRQLQLRQEKALQRYDDTESEISQLLSRHANETHVLRERLRRSQERERASERRLKDSEEQLHRSQTTITRLKKLVDQRELGARDELSRRLDEEKVRSQEAERKIKELERSLELTTNSYQRQLAAERRKTLSAQEEIQTLQDELERLTNKLKEKERELDAKNIYANRMMKSSIRNDTDGSTKRKVSSRNSAKSVQTKDRMCSLEFPTPPPAITDAGEFSQQAPDEYLSLKELHRPADTEGRNQKHEEKELVEEREDKPQLNQASNLLEEKASRLRDGWEKEKEEEDRKRTSSLFSQEEENNRKRGHVQEELRKWNQDALASQPGTEEARRKKDQLLAKMHEIDRLNQAGQAAMFAEPSSSTGSHSSPEQRIHSSLIFNLTEPDELASLRASAGSREGGRRRPGLEGGVAMTGLVRRALRSQNSNDDSSFGSYAPSFGHPASRGSPGFPPPPPTEDRNTALEAIGVFSLRGAETERENEVEKGAEKDRRSSLMQQLFGTLATSAAGDSMSLPNRMELLGSPPATNGIRSRRDGLFSFSSGSSTPPVSSVNTLHVADSRPAVRAVASFDDDIEELTL